MTKFQLYSRTTVHQKAGKKLDGLDLKEKDIQGNRGKILENITDIGTVLY